MPKRRTLINFDAPKEMDRTAFPIVGDVPGSYYFRPEAGGLMASPADETPSPPCDAQPDEIDMAIIVDRMQRATLFEIRASPIAGPACAVSRLTICRWWAWPPMPKVSCGLPVRVALA